MKKLLLTLAAGLTVGAALASAAPRIMTIGVVAKSQGNPVFQAARVGAQDAAKELSAKHGLDIRIDWRTPNEEDAQKQAEAIEQLVLAGAEGLAVSCSDANKLTDAINRAVERHFGNRMPQLIIEPGRGMTGDAGVIQTEVVLISEKGYGETRRWVFLDIGKFGGLAETMDESIQYRIRTRHDGTETGPVILAGPTCDSADVLYDKADYRLPLALRIGDKIEIHATGAYTTSYSAVGFNGFPPLQEHYI